MKKNIFTALLALTFVLSGNLNAQDYKSAVGVKLTFGAMGTYKMEIKENLYADIYAGLYYGLSAGAAIEMHKPIESVDFLYWYVGGGAYGGINTDGIHLGVNAVFGVDYTFEEIPLNVSFDWMPGLNIVGGIFPTLIGGGFSARYIINRN